ncbi:MAG: chromate transporter [bacterium]
MKQNIRKQADDLYRRGLLVFNQPVTKETLRLVTELWQEALKLYRRVGDRSKAREIEKALINLYRKKPIRINNKEKQGSNIPVKFANWDLFFKIGCLGFGGPMAVFSLLENELVRQRKILTDKDFLEGAVLGDILPGPVTMDIVTYTGYKLKKWSGAVLSTVVFILPSFILMIILAMLYNKYQITPKVEAIFKCLGAAVTGLIVSVGLKLGEQEIQDYRGAGILIWAFTSALIFKFDILTVVGLAGIAGTLLYIGTTEKENSP